MRCRRNCPVVCSLKKLNTPQSQLCVVFLIPEPRKLKQQKLKGYKKKI